MIWEIKDPMKFHAQRRRAEVSISLLQPQTNDVILDVGCGDGFQMSYVIRHSSHVVGLDVSIQKLREAKHRVKETDFVCASSERLPFQSEVFHKIMCLELLEHLENPSKTLSEIDLVLKDKGILIVSVPYNERIVMTECIHCHKLTPLWGHLHSFDEKKISSILPKNYALLQREYACTIVTSYLLFSSLPTRCWKIVDNLSRLLPGVRPSWFIHKFQKV